MSVSVTDGPVIVAGYAYRLQLEAESPVFPEGCSLAADVRARVSDTAIIATLTTANGGLARISDNAIVVVIPPAATASLPPGSVVMDMVRTDLEPDQHLGFSLEIPVIRPVTRGL